MLGYVVLNVNGEAPAVVAVHALLYHPFAVHEILAHLVFVQRVGGYVFDFPLKVVRSGMVMVTLLPNFCI